MSNEQIIWDSLKSRGLNDFAVAGIIGNLFAESGLRPDNLQNSYEKKLGMSDAEYTAAVDNGSYDNFVNDKAGYGLAQWTYWSRKQALLNYCKAYGTSISDLQMQLGFLWQELQGYSGVMKILKCASSVREASDAILLQYERPADQSETVQIKRATYGMAFYDEYATKEESEVNNMDNSKLVDCVVKSPNHSGKRTHAVDRITPHCVVGQLSAESIGGCFTSTSRQASCNYGIGKDGRVALIVDEDNRSWCSSSGANDQRAITIECASDKTEPYAFNDAVYSKLVALCVDICQRYGKTKLLWIENKDTALAYEPAADEMLLTVHRWFANKSCPGAWLYERMGQLATTVTEKLGGKEEQAAEQEQAAGQLYRVQVGAYSVKANADAQLAKVKAAGFDAFVTTVGNMYKVQVGAYSVKANADSQLAKVKAAGFDAFITTEGQTATQTEGQTTTQPAAPQLKSVDEVAKEVINGSWGNGDERKQRLEAAGYNYSEVQAKVNELCNQNTAPALKSVDEVAREVIKGDWGNGAERKQRLEAAGYSYSEVQARVNELCK